MHVRGMGEAAEKRSAESQAVTAARKSLPLYVMLVLSVTLFGVQLALSHVTHALTLLVDSYHMLCNIIALAGCIITIKKGLGGGSSPIRSTKASGSEDQTTEHSTLREPAADRRLRNTFGWARVDVLVSLIGSVFLASLCFSLLVEAVQTLLHIDHHDEMHEPLYVAGAGVASLLLNVLCYVLLGGYTFHQGSFFHVTENGDVVLEPAVTQDSVKMGERRLSAQRRVPPRTRPQFRQRQGCREMVRDTVGCVLVIATSLIVFFTDQSVAKYADPVMSIVSAILLLVLSYPYMKEAGLILLQTIPEHININQLRSDFQQAFPDVENIHDLHVWRLNQAKVFCTAHVRFRNARDYLRINQDVGRFFAEYGVTQVTVQPEFHPEGAPVGARLCLMSCPGESCLQAHCCAPPPDQKHYLRIASDLSLPGNGHADHHHHDHRHDHHDHHHHHHAPYENKPLEMDVVARPQATSAATTAAPTMPGAASTRATEVAGSVAAAIPEATETAGLRRKPAAGSTSTSKPVKVSESSTESPPQPPPSTATTTITTEAATETESTVTNAAEAATEVTVVVETVAEVETSPSSGIAEAEGVPQCSSEDVTQG